MHFFKRPDDPPADDVRLAACGRGVVGAGASLGVLLAALAMALMWGNETRFPSAGLAVTALLVCCLATAGLFRLQGHVRRSVAALTAEAAASRQAQHSAEAVSEAASRALAVAAHEIRTPLSGIIGMLDILLDTPLSAEQRNYAKTAAASARALLSIAEDLLDETGHRRPGGTTATHGFDPAALAESITELLAPRAHAKGIELSCFVSERVPAALAGDERRLRQVLLNLCGNAIKFTETGGVALEFHRVGETKLRIAVSDTGIGLTEDEQQRIFEEFVQANGDTRRLFGGTGMGLAICRKLVDAMGGEISVRSAPGAGSVFEVILPLGESLTAAPAAAPPGGACILAAQASIATHHLQLMLEEKGVRVRRIGRAEDFVAALSSGRPAFTGHLICDAAFAGILRQWSGHEGHQPPSRFAVVLRPEERVHFEDLLTLPGAAFLPKPVRRAAIHRLLTGEIDPTSFAGARSTRNVTERLAGQDPRSILLAEDDPANALLARSILERAGWRVRQAQTGREVLQLLKTGDRPDMILMDIGMPVLDGLETARLIRRAEADASLPRLPILALTARVRERDLAECFAAGMDGHLAKPFDQDDLEAALAKLALRHAAA